MKKRIMRVLYVDYKVKGSEHLNLPVGEIDFKLSEIEDEDYICQQELIAEFHHCDKNDVEIIKFHF